MTIFEVLTYMEDNKEVSEFLQKYILEGNKGE